MIQLATDPAASRNGFQPNREADGKAPSLSLQRRTGHAWPFLSRTIERPTLPDSRKPSYGNHGS